MECIFRPGSNVVKAFQDDYFWELAEVESSDEAGAQPPDEAIVHKMVDDDVIDFDTCDLEHVQQFKVVGYGKILRCYVHTLQLVITCFNKDKYVMSLVNEVYKLVRLLTSNREIVSTL